MLFLESLFLEYDYDLVHNKNKIILESAYDKLIKFIIADIDRLSDSKERLIPHEFELQFGKDYEFEIRSDGESIPMVGIIDRIDKLVDKDAYVVMDYKSSSYGVRNLDHMKSGLSLQLPVYIMSNFHREVVAGVYGVIGSAKFEVPIGILEKSKVISKSHKGGMSQEEWEELLDATGRNILNIVKGIKSGDFSVNPLECSPYCIYKDICRYEKTVEVEG
jgi:ATP-dependent helicase/DNAse subunit B